MTDFSDAPAQIERLLRDVDHGATSTTKYREFEQYLGEFLDIPWSGIYPAYVAKPGNFDVRMTQSERARDARLRVALLPREADLPYIEELAARIAIHRYTGSAVLLICDGPDGWAPRWGLQPRADEHPVLRPFNLERFNLWFDNIQIREYSYQAPSAPVSPEETRALLAEFLGFFQDLLPCPNRKYGISLLKLRCRRRCTGWNHPYLANFIENDVTANDVVAIAHRRAVIERFRRLLEEPEFF